MSPKCPNGHEGGSSLKCSICGSAVSYVESLSDLLSFPIPSPDFGKLAVLSVGVPRLGVSSDYLGEIVRGSVTKPDLERLTLETGSGSNWYEMYKRHSVGTARWLRLVAFEESKYKVIIADTTDPVSALAVASLSRSDTTVLLAIGADKTSTPVEQNTSHVTLTLALEKGFEVVVFPQRVVKEAMFVSPGGNFASGIEAFSFTLEKLLAHFDDLMETLQSDRGIGILLHSASTISPGSTQLYGSVANAVGAQAYQLPSEIGFTEVKTFHSLVWCEKILQTDFEKNLSEFRQNKFPSAIGSENKFFSTEGGTSFELFTLFGTDKPGILRVSLEGYEAVAKQAPALQVGSIS